ncbi:conserved hypothetical protein [Altererythrobacter sp. B11]|uniref:HIRAN domain-containing protein n=1 Tax=Altererythrobacter sp. B11 TaxID=2060312 RepID=UPI000DC71315|nr:HIRAN domain-containing protein [Altererythrobacter sp. B11]BBC72898.1 conserved hypothetical protein [Altererythrobacter sp. B11]
MTAEGAVLLMVVLGVVAVAFYIALRAAERGVVPLPEEPAADVAVEEEAAVNAPSPARRRRYPQALVGEQHYQDAIAGCRAGDTVTIWHEPDNPYDPDALAVADQHGRTLGYLPRDSFVHEAVLDDEKGCRASILSLEDDRSGKGFVHVTVEVELLPHGVGEPVSSRSYTPE